MDKFWSIFWKLFGAMLVITIVAGIILGVLKHSFALAQYTIRMIVTFGFGVCGIIALIAIPLEMYIDDRAGKNDGYHLPEDL
jgi:predicted membrane-bound spermidine synthase